MLGTISGALARSLIYPITLNGYIYSPGKKKSKKSKKNRKNKKKLKKIKNARNNFWGPCQVLNIPYHIEWLYIQSWQKKSKK